MTKKRAVPREPQSRPSSCVGCGDAANGYNYDAPSCNSCKTFFRRTVTTKKQFKGCLLGGMCEKGESIRQCRACRYAKCISGGMNPSLIVGDECTTETSKPSTSSEGTTSSNELVQTSTSGSSSSGSACRSIVRADSSYSVTEMQMLHNPLRVENLAERWILNLLTIEEAHQKLRVSKYTPILSDDLTIDGFVHGPSKLGEEFGTMCLMPYEPVAIKLFPVEAIIQRRIYMDFSKFDYTKRKLWIIQDVIYSVEFIKALPVYHLLDDHSKKVLLSSALTCSNYTTAFYSYRLKSDHTFFPDGTVMAWDQQTREQSPYSARYHTAIIAAIKEADLDAKEYALLKLIIVCNPMLDGLTPYSANVLCLEKERCTKALVSYILARRGVQEGPAYFAKMVSVINVLIELTSWVKGQHILAIAMGLYNTPTPFFESVFNSV